MEERERRVQVAIEKQKEILAKYGILRSFTSRLRIQFDAIWEAGIRRLIEYAYDIEKGNINPIDTPFHCIFWAWPDRYKLNSGINFESIHKETKIRIDIAFTALENQSNLSKFSQWCVKKFITDAMSVEYGELFLIISLEELSCGEIFGGANPSSYQGDI